MASFVIVVDSSARRAKIKTTPGKSLSEVLQEACGELRYDASRHGLKYNNRIIDLSRNIRLSGLSSGAKLELFKLSKSPSVISVALQLPESEKAGVTNGRMMDKFPSSTSLWQLLRRFESATAGGLGAQKNFTGRGVPSLANGSSGSGRLYYEGPVLHILGRDYSSLADLQKSLSQLGVNDGSVLLKLSFRASKIPLEQAQKEIETYFKSLDQDDSNAQGVHSEAVGSEPSTTATQQTLNEDKAEAQLSPCSEPAEDDLASPAATSSDEGKPDHSISQDTPSSPPPEPASTVSAHDPQADTSSSSVAEPNVVGPDQRPMLIFAPSTSTTPQAALLPHKESDYEPTIAQHQRHQANLGKQTQQQRLQSDKEIETQKKSQAEKLASIQNVEIKVKFPDEMQVVSKLNSLDTATTLYDYVTGLMENESEPFFLKFMSAKGIPKVIPKGSTAKLISDLGMTGRLAVHFVWEAGATPSARSGNILKAKFRELAQEIEVKEVESGTVEDKPNLGWGRLGEGKSQGDAKPTGAAKFLEKLRKK